MLEFRLLGPLEVVDGERSVALPGRKARATLAALLLRAGEEVSADRLIDDIWGEQAPSTARNSLHNHVSALRKALGPETVVTGSSGYLIRIEDDQLDLARFRQLVEAAQAIAEDDARAQTLRDALALWRGSALADLAYEPFGVLEAPRLEELRLAAQVDLLDAELALGRHADLLPELESLVEAHPFDERLRGQLMLALYRAGRQADALDAYAETRRFLVDELGIEPSQPLRDLQQALLRQDEELLPTTPERPAQAALLAGRKTVSILFADLVDSTVLAQRLDPEALRSVLERAFAVARAVVERHGGVVEKFVGDAVLAVFGIPLAHEDDALRALRSAVELRGELASLDEALQLRIGVNTGEVFVGGAVSTDALVTGVAVNVAKRLEEAASPGEILIGPSTLVLVREAVTTESRPSVPIGSTELGAWQLLELIEGAPAIPRQFGTELAGREQELYAIERAFDEAQASCCPRFVVLVGEPGIGKSRLAREFCSKQEETAFVLVGQCVSYGEGATWLPLVEALRGALGAHPDRQLTALLDGEESSQRATATISALLGGFDAPTSTAEVFWALRLLLERLGRERPVVLVLEDAHWAESTLLDFVEYVDGFAGAPILILCLTRPELLDERPTWAEHATSLGRLPLGDMVALLESIGADQLEPAGRDRVAEAAEGNPLLAEQLLAWAAEGGGLDVLPPSVEALLQSRIDLLEEAERRAIERAAVIGREFTIPAAQALGPPEASAALRERLFSLVRKGMLEPAPARRAQNDGFRFHHALVRDAAYASIPKADRSGLHERVAEWLELQEPMQDELVGYHLEQAYRYRAELGRVDRHARGLAADAGDRLGTAGIRAWKRADVAAAVNLLARATALLPSTSDHRRELLCELGVALRAGGEIEQSKRVLAEAAETAAAVPDRRLELRARIELGDIEVHTDPGADTDAFLALASSSIPVFESVEDDRALGRTWLLIGYVQGGHRCLNRAWAEAAERSLGYYRRSGWPPGTCLGNIAAALYHGPTPVSEGIERCARLLDETDDRSAEANVQVLLGGFKALQGSFAEARALVDEATMTFEELGQAVQGTHNARWMSSQIELLAGDSAAAAAHLSAICEFYRAADHGSFLATAGAELAEAYYRLGLDDDAERWTRVSENHAGPADLSAQFSWRGVRAKVFARQGRPDPGERLARESLTLVERSDALNQHAKALLDLAEVMRLRGSGSPAKHIGAALALYAAKENAVGTEEAQRLLGELVGA
jgi:DNA-binding SARP family transcriptional activator